MEFSYDISAGLNRGARRDAYFSSAFDSAEVERRAKEALQIDRDDVMDVEDPL
jgi:hypothetical protein